MEPGQTTICGAPAWPASRQVPHPHHFLRNVLIPFACTRGLLLLAACLALWRLSSSAEGGWNGPTSSAAINMWSHFDGLWYLSIARDGYQFAPGAQSNAAFAPLFPMLMRIGGQLAGGSDAAMLAAGIILSNLALLAAVGYLAALMQLEGHDQAAARAGWYLLIFPTSFFLSAVYPMSLFLALATGAFYHARRGQWPIAGTLAAMAALSRPDGVLLSAGLALEYFLQYRGSPRRDMLWLASGPAALLAWMAFQWHRFGDPLAFVVAQRQWDPSPIQTVMHSSRAGLQLGCAGLFVLLVILCLRFLRPSYTLFAASMLAVMLAAARFWSITRFVVVLFPAFMLLAILGRRWRIIHLAYTAIATPLSFLLMMRFALNLWVA
ncbi:MAG: mannosyltransferase family protein [Tepidisphaeraceae bacterium]